MITLDHDTWTTLVGLAGFALMLATLFIGITKNLKTELTAAIVGVRTDLTAAVLDVKTDLKNDIVGVRTDLTAALLDVKTDLKNDIVGVRTDLKDGSAGLDSKIDRLRTELHGDINKVDDRLTAIESRTYDISTRLPAATAGPATS